MKPGTNYRYSKLQCQCASSQLHLRSRDPAATRFLSEPISRPSMSSWAAMVPAAVFESRRSRSSERQAVTELGISHFNMGAAGRQAQLQEDDRRRGQRPESVAAAAEGCSDTCSVAERVSMVTAAMHDCYPIAAAQPNSRNIPSLSISSTGCYCSGSCSCSCSSWSCRCHCPCRCHCHCHCCCCC